MRGVAGTWNGAHGAQHDHRLQNRERGLCINCSRPRGSTIRCELCRRRHNAEVVRAKKSKPVRPKED